MKKTLITTGIIIVAAMLVLYVFNRLTTKDDRSVLLAEVNRGPFEISVSATGELLAENSIDIMGPAFSQGRDVRSTSVKITDLIPEGTEVKKGDYVALLDKTELDNALKDAQERVDEMEEEMQMLLLDTSMTMNNIRDQIANQIHNVEEAEITLKNSKYEPPTTQREAEINVEQAKRVLEQLYRSYELRMAQTNRNVQIREMWLSRMKRRVSDYQEVLDAFTITAPADGMVIYYKTRMGTKRKAGMNVNAVDRIIATLPDLSSMLSKVYISEVEISKIRVGLPAVITVDAFPDKSYTGTITSIANIGETLPNSDTKVFEVMIKLDGSDLNLRPSMTTNNKIIINTFEDVIFIPTECVHTGSDSIPVVYTKSGLRQKVTLGQANDKFIIIRDGLEPGTPIYIEIPEGHHSFRDAV
ncbi:MAG: efflux RND transporter periplasmic adaptor subunit [Bacteroidales bacterium]|nr:efflux RND transporter periplasmic adaptor subunit [Bacteroidales bacterium]MBN2631944.1 efflux RND transporter periplasmic adaptor subunit [Bacteroidales bacterium]